MKESPNQRDRVLRLIKYTLPNNQQISLLATDKEPVCFQNSPNSLWEPIGQENVGVATAINRFWKLRQ